VDHDGRDDLLVYIDSTAIEISPDATTLSMSARASSGRGLVGSDRVTVAD